MYFSYHLKTTLGKFYVVLILLYVLLFIRYGVTLFAVRPVGKNKRIVLNPGPSHVMNYEDRCFYIAISSEEDTAFKAYKEPKEPVGLFKGSFRQKNDSFITASSVALELRPEPGITLTL